MVNTSPCRSHRPLIMSSGEDSGAEHDESPPKVARDKRKGRPECRHCTFQCRAAALAEPTWAAAAAFPGAAHSHCSFVAAPTARVRARTSTLTNAQRAHTHSCARTHARTRTHACTRIHTRARTHAHAGARARARAQTRNRSAHARALAQVALSMREPMTSICSNGRAPA